jgi:hypothetical protein
LTCSDASSWSSSSDITEPVSPASPASSHPSPLSQTSASEVHSPSATTVPSPSQEADADAEGKNCNACDAARPAAAQKVDASCKRRRRFSDSAPPTTAEARPTQRKRARRLSGSCSGSGSCEFPCGAAVASKWSAYSCLWRNKWNSSATRGPVATQCKLDVSPHRLSWPVCRDELKKTGQMKITEFFSSQVKQHWNYQHKTSAIKVEEPDRRIDLQDGSPTRCDGLPEACRESRVSIVSVAHVDPSVDSNFSPNVQNLVDSAEQAESSSRQPASPLCPTEASNGGDQSHLEANGQSSSAATPQIRFPVDQGKNDSSLACTVVQCLWKDCGVSVNLTSGQSLLEHIHSVHVASQAGSQSSSTSSSSSETTERYVCEWEGCKVQGRTSSSRAWLERHVLTHGGNKPFRCIVESCDQRFSSQVIYPFFFV